MRIHPALRSVPLVFGFVALTMGARECETPAPGSCVVDGVTYANGSSAPSPDGCNTCSCIDGEITACTERACAPPDGMCEVDGVFYPHGTSGIPAPDGCNTCVCNAGALACTEIGCAPPDGACVVDGVSYPSGSGGIPSPDGCNVCGCNDGLLICTERACAPEPGVCSVFGTAYADGWLPSPDGCNSCGCDDGHNAGICTEIACGPIAIEACTAWSSPFVSDRFDLNGVTLSGDTLTADVAYSGGCAPHYFRLCYDAFLESNPVQVDLRLEHDAQGDECEAYPSESRSFDLGPLADAYRAGYGTPNGRLILRIGDGLDYTF
ncbi:MAG: hypothetical protein AB7S26_06955 [Sandaracinaceae bacterium]